MSRPFDENEETSALAALIRESLEQPRRDPQAARLLRAQLVSQRAEAIRTPARPIPQRRLQIPVGRRSGLALTLAFAAAASVVVVFHNQGSPTPSTGVALTSPQQGVAGVDPSGSVTMTFSTPVDQAAVQRALHISPATLTSYRWSGQTLAVTPVHGFIPNTAYQVTIAGAAARTADGRAFSSDGTLVFGTADRAIAAGAAPAAVVPAVTEVSPADAGSEGVFTATGTLIATSARTAAGSSLLAVSAGGHTSLGDATDAICVSPSGHSVAWVTTVSGHREIAVSGAGGSDAQLLAVQVDAGSPLGWRGDDAVTYVAGGHVHQVDRAGHDSTLVGPGVDPAHDALAVAPNSTYLFRGVLGSDSQTLSGVVVDLVTGESHSLDGVTAGPAFSGDGATAAWGRTTPGGIQLLVAASAGGPARLLTTLPAGTAASDMALSPDGSELALVEHPADGGPRTVVVSTVDGSTVASAALNGTSPNWSTDGRRLAVVDPGVNGGTLLVVEVGGSGSAARVRGTLALAAAAQATGDTLALGSLASAGTGSALVTGGFTRATILAVAPGVGNGSWVGALRLVRDGTVQDPVPQAALERVDLQVTGAGVVITNLRLLEPFAPETAGPHVVATFVAPSGGGLRLAVLCDADMDAASVARAFTVTGPNGSVLARGLAYDPQTHLATVTLASTTGGALQLAASTQLRDAGGAALAVPLNALIGG